MGGGTYLVEHVVRDTLLLHGSNLRPARHTDHLRRIEVRANCSPTGSIPASRRRPEARLKTSARHYEREPCRSSVERSKMP